MAATMKMFRLNAWQVAMREVPGGELRVMTETPKVQRVGQFGSLDAAMKAAACVEDGLALASIPFGPMLGEGRKWSYNPETRQLGREASTGVWLFGIKTVVVQTADAKAAEAAKAAKATEAQKARAAATAARAAEVAMRKDGEAHEVEMAARRAAAKANWKHGEELKAALSGGEAAKARTAEEIASLHAYEAEVAASAASAKADAALPL